MGADQQFNHVVSNHVRVGSGGEILTLNTSAEEPIEEIVFPTMPFKVGETWNSSSNGIMGKSTITNLNATLKTPLQTFSNCLVVKTKSASGESRSYFQKGVGMVALALIVDEEEKLMVYLAD
jgi:hypothetical protein